MPLTINSNSASASASFYMSKNNYALQKSINRLSSGSKIVHPNDDAGGLAVSMKLESMVTRLKWCRKKYSKCGFIFRGTRWCFIKCW